MNKLANEDTNSVSWVAVAPILKRVITWGAVVITVLVGVLVFMAVRGDFRRASLTGSVNGLSTVVANQQDTIKQMADRQAKEQAFQDIVTAILANLNSPKPDAELQKALIQQLSTQQDAKNSGQTAPPVTKSSPTTTTSTSVTSAPRPTSSSPTTQRSVPPTSAPPSSTSTTSTTACLQNVSGITLPIICGGKG